MSFFTTIKRTPLFKVASLNSVSVILKIAIGVITSKVLAIFIGPSGLALTGNLKNFLTSVESIATLGFQNGIVKYVAECKDDRDQLQKTISTVFITLLAIAFLLSGILYFFDDFWNKQIFGNHFEYEFVIKALAIALPWFAISIFFLSVINGLGKSKEVIWINIIGNTVGLVVSLTMILQFKTLGALLSVVISPALLFFVTFYFVSKEFNFIKLIQYDYYDFRVIRNLN